LKEAGYPEKADPAKIHYPMVLLLLTILVIYVTMVYGPIAAWLVELFPARIRYTSMSLPYHIGNGWFGGFLPTVAFAMVAARGYLLRLVVPDRDCGDDGGAGHLLPAGNQGPGYHPHLMMDIIRGQARAPRWERACRFQSKYPRRL
jgi:hypothetical protein